MSDRLIKSQQMLKAYKSFTTSSDWDLIIVTASDESQRRAVEMKLNQMKDNDKHLIGHRFKFMVISDQQFMNGSKAGLKLGSGGSTLHIFREISERFGKNYFYENKILLIHSGGYSQRIPHFSVLGKLFSNLPIDLDKRDKLWTSLDLKLALLSPFASKMKNGVWITASDDIVIYCFNEKEFESIPQLSENCFVCLGHPSTVDISLNHGVYVLPTEELNSINSNTISLHNCLKVLQKPTLDQLLKHNAIIGSDSNRLCITDSSYYIGSDIIVNKLLKFPINGMDFEIDCYGDFLCPLGSSPITSDQNDYYSPLNEILFGTKIKVLYLSQSKFFHLGTIEEYMRELTEFGDKDLGNGLGFKPIKSSNNKIKGTVMCSLISDNSIIDSKSLIEYCDFNDIEIQTDNNLLYNCIVSKGFAPLSVIKFPSNYLIYSVPVIIDNTKGWTTFGFEFKSKLKSSLWSAKLFPVCKTSTQSLVSTLKLIENPMNSDQFSDTIKISMSDIKQVKDIDTMLDIQNLLKSNYL